MTFLTIFFAVLSAIVVSKFVLIPFDEWRDRRDNVRFDERSKKAEQRVIDWVNGMMEENNKKHDKQMADMKAEHEDWRRSQDLKYGLNKCPHGQHVEVCVECPKKLS